MSKGSKKKAKQLGMPFGTATNRLRKRVMFNLIQKSELDICFQCGEIIESVGDLSVEHKTPWMDSNNPVELFFDLSNIAFSHIKCNIGSARKEKGPKVGHGSPAMYNRGCRCRPCTDTAVDRVRQWRKKSGITSGSAKINNSNAS